MTTTLTREQAEAGLAAVKAQWAAYIEPRDHSGHTHDEPLTGADLEAHLADAHGWDSEMLARRHAAGMSTADVHDRDHKPEAVYPEPTLIEDYTDSGHWAVVWEEGPEDWPFLLGGGTSEDDHVTYAHLSAELGTTVAPPVHPAAAMPADVFAEPVSHIVVGLYPA